MVYFGGVSIDSAGGLGAKVAVPGMEIECIDAIFAADTLELYSTYHLFSGVVFQSPIVVLYPEGKNKPQWAVEGNVDGRMISVGAKSLDSEFCEGRARSGSLTAQVEANGSRVNVRKNLAFTGLRLNAFDTTGSFDSGSEVGRTRNLRSPKVLGSFTDPGFMRLS